MTERWEEIEDEIQRECYPDKRYVHLGTSRTPVHRNFRERASKRIAELEQALMEAIQTIETIAVGDSFFSPGEPSSADDLLRKLQGLVRKEENDE